MADRSREELTGIIAGADQTEKLRFVREREQNRLFEAIQASNLPFPEAEEQLCGLHDALIVRAVELAEQQMARQGHRAPPVPYAYILFGSGGRREMTLFSDQDSGIVYADPESERHAEVCSAYFSELADKAVQILMELGYPPCDGNVMASNPEFCLPLREWERKIDRWFQDPSFENVRYLLIVADGRAIAGDAGLVGRLKDRFFTDMLQSPLINRRMMENTLRHKVLVGVFGQLLRERYGENAGGLDIKYGAYIPMVNAFRLMAIQSGIRETNTLKRIEALKSGGRLAAAEAEEAIEAFSLFLKLRLLSVGSGKLRKEQLTDVLVRRLKKALKFGKKMQLRVERETGDRFPGR